MPDAVLWRLVKELGVDEDAVFEVPGPLDLAGLNAIADLPRRRAALPRVRAVDPCAPARSVHVRHALPSATSSCTTPTTLSPPAWSG